MRTTSFLRKSILENIRDWKIMIMTLIMAPVYVCITYLMVGTSSQHYQVLVNNLDRPAFMEDGTRLTAGNDLIQELIKQKNSDGSSLLQVKTIESRLKAEEKIKDRSTDLYIQIPESFSQSVQTSMKQNGDAKSHLLMTGDEENPKCQMAAVIVDTAAYGYISAVTGMDIPLDIEREPVKNAKAPTAFGGYIPGLLAVSLMSLIFTAAASIVKEVDKDTIKRIKISKIRPYQFLTAVSIAQAVISIPVMLLTYATAVLFGYEPAGSLFTVLVVGFLSSFSIVAISLIIASFLNTVFELMTIGSFPYFILLFFSGAWFPMPGKNLFSIAGHNISITDILPISHTVTAMNKILNFGSGLGDITFELGAIVVLTIAYFAIGVALFNRKHMRAV